MNLIYKYQERAKFNRNYQAVRHKWVIGYTHLRNEFLLAIDNCSSRVLIAGDSKSVINSLKFLVGVHGLSVMLF